jgi:hypothetical protein
MFWILQVVQSFKIIKFKGNLKERNYDFCFGFLKDSLNVLKLQNMKEILKN